MIFLDFETRSYCDLKQYGAWNYSIDDTTDIICMCWAVDGSEVFTWTPDDPWPQDLFNEIAAGHEVEAHNVAFEISIWTNVAQRKYGFPPVPFHQWRDLMATACYYAMPAQLDQLALALGLGGKDPEGGRLITKYSKLHLKTAKTEIPVDDLDKFVNYCAWDVQLERAISDYLGDLPDRELRRFQLDLETNLRGLYIDVAGIENASAIVDEKAEALTAEFVKLTGGIKPTQIAQVKDWLEMHGLKVENMQKDHLEELMEEGEIPLGPARRALEIRLKINKASTKKLAAMGRHASHEDGRARFQTRYHGAMTGRNTGSGFQPLNLLRGDEKIDPDRLVADISWRDGEWLDMIYGDAMQAVANASRHWICAEEGNLITAGDFSSIEAIILSCLAGEEWKVQAFHDGAKMYELMGEKIHGLEPGTVTKATHPAERQDGKTGELAFGYQGALGAWRNFDSSDRHSDERVIEICKAWRAEHPMTVAFWRGLETAATAAMNGGEHGFRDIGFERVDEWLTMVLPNGKRLWYRDPQIRMGMPPWHKPHLKEDCASGDCNCEPVPKLTYMAQKEGRWRRVYTYGGKLTENAVQATSREILEPAKMKAAEAGYPLILTVYDEIVSEHPEHFGSVEEFEEIMIEGALSPEFAQGWPIKVEGWRGKRYRK